MCLNLYRTKIETRSRQGTWKTAKKLEDVELQALLDEDGSQTRKQLPEQFGVSQEAVSDWLREMGKIQKTGRWVPRKLNDRQMEYAITHVTFCSLGAKVNRFCIVELQGMKSRFILRIPSPKHHG